MATLSQIILDFNRKIKLSNDGGSLSSDTGEFIFREFDEKLDSLRQLLNISILKTRGSTMFIPMKIYSGRRIISSLLVMPKMIVRMN